MSRLRTWFDGGTCQTPDYDAIGTGRARIDLDELFAHWECRDRLRSHRWFINPWKRMRYQLDPANLAYKFRKLTVYPWQRVVRGWDDTQLWNLDHTMACLLADMIGELRHRGHGYVSLNAQGRPCSLEEDRSDPVCASPDQWHAILDEMIVGFSGACDAIVDDSDRVPLQRSWDLLAKWHHSLWD